MPSILIQLDVATYKALEQIALPEAGACADSRGISEASRFRGGSGQLGRVREIRGM